MKLNTLHDVLTHELQDIYSAETQIIEALPKMMQAAANSELKTAFETHLKQTKQQLKRLEEVCEGLDIKAEGQKCKGMEGLLKEGEEVIKIDGKPEAKDAALISAAQRVEHYEIAAYGCAITFAKLMNHAVAVKLLKETIDEEEKTDKLLTKIAESQVNNDAQSI